MRLKPTKTTIGILGGIIGLILLCAGGTFYFITKQVGAVQAQVDAKEQELEDGQQIALRRDMALANLEADREQIQFLETGVSDAAYVPTMLRQLELLALSTNNKVVSVRPLAEVKAPTKIQQRRDIDAGDKGGDKKDGEAEEPEEPYTRLNIQVSLIGRYATAQAFIDRLTRFPKIVAVNELSIRPHKAQNASSQVSDDGTLDVDMKVTAFVMKELAAPKTAPVTASAAGAGGIN